MEIWISLIIIVGSLIGGIIFITMFLTFLRAHKLRIRDPTNKGLYVEDFLVTEIKDKETGVLYWRSVWWQKKISTPKPPDKAIEIGKKGKKFAECYKLTEDQYCWITDKGIKINKVFNEKKQKDELQIVDVSTDGKEKYVDTFKPFSSTQRDIIVQQFKKAQEISKNRWTPDKLIMAGSLGMFFVLIMMVIIFWGDIAAPLLDMQGATSGMMTKAESITRNQALILEQLGGDTSGLDFNTPQTPKSVEPIQATDPLANPLQIFRDKS